MPREKRPGKRWIWSPESFAWTFNNRNAFHLAVNANAVAIWIAFSFGCQDVSLRSILLWVKITSHQIAETQEVPSIRFLFHLRHCFTLQSCCSFRLPIFFFFSFFFLFFLYIFCCLFDCEVLCIWFFTTTFAIQFLFSLLQASLFYVRALKYTH